MAVRLGTSALRDLFRDYEGVPGPGTPCGGSLVCPLALGYMQGCCRLYCKVYTRQAARMGVTGSHTVVEYQ